MKNRKAFNRFIATRKARAILELAALNLMPHIYATEKMAEKVASKQDWLEQVVKDSKCVLNLQYIIAGRMESKVWITDGATKTNRFANKAQ